MVKLKNVLFRIAMFIVDLFFRLIFVILWAITLIPQVLIILFGGWRKLMAFYVLTAIRTLGNDFVPISNELIIKENERKIQSAERRQRA